MVDLGEALLLDDLRHLSEDISRLAVSVVGAVAKSVLGDDHPVDLTAIALLDQRIQGRPNRWSRRSDTPLGEAVGFGEHLRSVPLRYLGFTLGSRPIPRVNHAQSIVSVRFGERVNFGDVKRVNDVLSHRKSFLPAINHGLGIVACHLTSPTRNIDFPVE